MNGTNSRSQDEKQGVAAFIRELYARSPYESQASFAGAAGVGAAELSNWLNGRRSLDGVNLLRLIRASGVLAEILGPPAPSVVAREQLAELEELRKRVQRLEVLARDAGNGVQER